MSTTKKVSKNSRSWVDTPKNSLISLIHVLGGFILPFAGKIPANPSSLIFIIFFFFFGCSIGHACWSMTSGLARSPGTEISLLYNTQQALISLVTWFEEDHRTTILLLPSSLIILILSPNRLKWIRMFPYASVRESFWTCDCVLSCVSNFLWPHGL